MVPCRDFWSNNPGFCSPSAVLVHRPDELILALGEGCYSSSDSKPAQMVVTPFSQLTELCKMNPEFAPRLQQQGSGGVHSRQPGLAPAEQCAGEATRRCDRRAFGWIESKELELGCEKCVLIPTVCRFCREKIRMRMDRPNGRFCAQTVEKRVFCDVQLCRTMPGRRAFGWIEAKELELGCEK